MRDIVIVLGVDRSGSSLCASFLQGAGVDLGNDLLTANEFNERGYFESGRVVAINEGILDTLGRSWDTLHGLQPLAPAWWRTPPMQQWREQVVGLLQDWMGRTGRVLGLKDPRFCVLLPLWQEAFALCGLSPRYVLTVRHPCRVARSLGRRDGFSSAYSELYWLERYCLASEAIAGAPSCIVHYEEWFTSPRQQSQRLLDFLGIEVCGGAVDPSRHVKSVIERRLRHDDGNAATIHLRTAERLNLCLKAGGVPGPAEIRGLYAADDVVAEYSKFATPGSRFWKGACGEEDLLPRLPENLRSARSTEPRGWAAVDCLNKRAPAKETPIRVDFNSRLMLEGWAFNEGNNTAAEDVYLIFTNNSAAFYAKATRTRREDLTTDFGPGVLNAGFRLRIERFRVPQGEYSLKAIETAPEGPVLHDLGITVVVASDLDTPR